MYATSSVPAPGVSALSYAAYTLAMVVIRLGGMHLHSRVSARRLLPALALFAAVGMSVTLAAANPVVSVVGFACVGAGVALLVPTAFSAAYSAGSGGIVDRHCCRDRVGGLSARVRP